MLRTTVFPMRHLNAKPAFWGFDRDLKEVIEGIENVTGGVDTSTTFTDFQETEKAYLMSIDMPGVNKGNLKLEVEGENILINATRKRAFSDEGDKEQKISRTLLMPKEVDKDKIQARCEDGVLYLALPKTEKEKPKKVEVTEGFKDTIWSNLLGQNEKENA